MLKFLLWNLNKKPLQDSIARLARMHEVDVIVLLENDIASDLLLRTLNPPGTGDYYFSPGLLCSKVQILCKFIDDFIKPIHESDRLTIRHLTLPNRDDILLAAVHFPSKLRWHDESQALECIVLIDDIIKSETLVGHTRTVLIGDLNMNPFESGVMGARGLHATMSGKIAQQRKFRIVQSKKYQFFYNPMWGLFGDTTPGPAGTYYYENAEHKVQFWHIFDQVLLRPNLISVFKNNDLKILETDGQESFLNKKGIPDKNSFSDHLPVLFSINI